MSGRPARTWIAVACASHVARGVAGGFMQVCHGKSGPLARIRPGDTVIYYSPTRDMGGGDGLQAFTAAGRVLPGEPYAFDMGDGFVPSRRDVAFWPLEPAAIRPLLDRLELTAGKRHWGAPFRYGLVAISEADGRTILAAMGHREYDRAA